MTKKILFIEDDKAVMEAYKIKFSPFYLVNGAVTGEEGLKLAISWRPDLIILDYAFPGGKSGDEVLVDLKKNEQTKKIPVIILTVIEGKCPELLKAGAVDCIIKTEVSMDTVIKKINSFLQ